MSTEKNLSNLVINKVESQDVYDYMKANSLINADELYFVEGDNEITITEATETESGLMSANDKVKLNGIEDGANKTVVDTVLNSTSTNPVQNKVINTKISSMQSDIDSKVPTTRTVNGKALNSNITLSASDVGALPNTTQIPSINGLATETYVNTKVAGLVDSAPTTLDTLNKLAAALGDDPNFATTIATQIGNKADKAQVLNITLAPASWTTSGNKFKYTYSNTSLRASVSPIITCTNNEKEYGYIADAEATANTGIVFTANKKPTSNIILTIIDIG